MHTTTPRRPTPSSRARSLSRRPTPPRRSSAGGHLRHPLRQRRTTAPTTSTSGRARPTPPAHAPPPPTTAPGTCPATTRSIEMAAPPGYYLPTPVPPITSPSLRPDGHRAFTDHAPGAGLVHKVATGNVNPAQLVLAGAVIDVTAGPIYGGTPVATCTTDVHGNCTTTAVLISGQPYCWSEVTAPPGLGGRSDRLLRRRQRPGRATDHRHRPRRVRGHRRQEGRRRGPDRGPARRGLRPLPKGRRHRAQRADPIDRRARPNRDRPGWPRSRPGQPASPRSPCSSPATPTAPSRPMPRPNYGLDSTEHCTTVLAGTTATPVPVTTLTVSDAEAQVTVAAHKFNSATPTTGIPGAVYDLYAVGAGPPSGPPSAAPTGVATETSDTWWARGTTTNTGDLSFTVPSGYAWCFHEVSAPLNYSLDPGLHCTPGSRPPPPLRHRRSHSPSRWPWSRSTPTSSTRSIPNGRPRCHLRAGRPGHGAAGVVGDGQPQRRPGAHWRLVLRHRHHRRAGRRQLVGAGRVLLVHARGDRAGRLSTRYRRGTARPSSRRPPRRAPPPWPCPKRRSPHRPCRPSPIRAARRRGKPALGGAFLLSGGVLLLVARRRKRPVTDATSVQPPGGRDG